MDLFSHANDQTMDRPLAERQRPTSFDGFYGQAKYSGQRASVLKTLRETGFLPNLILWGPPGTGKTTYALLISKEVKAAFIHANAVDTGAKELRRIGVEAQDQKRSLQERTLLFVDEIHRLNKSQQDVLLPFIEKGDLILVGATTENPSYELNSALLCRCRVLKFELLAEEDLKSILKHVALKEKIELNSIMTDECLKALVRSAHGDARQLLNRFEIIFQSHNKEAPFTLQDLEELHLLNVLPFDKHGEHHYDTISAFIKSVRGSDANAAIYYLARMLEAGEDPVFVARRLVILASEDIGNADPQALVLTTAALQAVELVGMPEARIALAQVTTYLAEAPKSNRSYVAIGQALEFVRQTGPLPVPLHLRSSGTSLSKSFGFGEGYKYSHDYKGESAKQSYLPEQALNKNFFNDELA